MGETQKPSREAELVRRLAEEGHLMCYIQEASDEERRQLRAGAAEIVWPLVFMRVTRPVERRRGHHQCATAVERLAPDCLDRFHDDVDAVLDDLFSRANLPIDNLEGWLVMRMRQATVDGYRRRRGERGAAQRPRVPTWLATALDEDTWLVELSKAILDWAGSEATAGISPWPLTAWTERRSAIVDGQLATEAVVAKDIMVVLAAMKQRPAWYEKNVERPLGRKRAPVWAPSRDASGTYAEPEPLALIPSHERDEALLHELAAQAIQLMERRIGAGEDPRHVVAEVLTVVFGDPIASRELDRPPNATGRSELTDALIEEPTRLDRIVQTMLKLLEGRTAGDRHRNA